MFLLIWIVCCVLVGLYMLRLYIVNKTLDDWIPYVCSRQIETTNIRVGYPCSYSSTWIVDCYEYLPSFDEMMFKPKYWLNINMSDYSGYHEFNKEIDRIIGKD